MNAEAKSNKLLAEFLGVKASYLGEYEMYGVIESIDIDDPHFYTPQTMEFVDDWNWMFTVLEKISTITGVDCRLDTASKTFYIGYNNLYRGTYIVGKGENRYYSMLYAVYVGCVEFVEWYNTKVLFKN